MKDWLDFNRKLLNWFKKHKRNLPWRKTTDPYAIWISEVMLQQTQVKTALPYYLKFLQQFPTLRALADSPLREVLKSWEGLGYYSRARHLHSTANEVRAKYAGVLPNTRSELLSLPGIGPYTASAVASIAFGEPSPVVDGNVWRVFSRLLADDSPSSSGKKKIFEFLQSIIPTSDPSSFNQAIMELGSMVCTPKNPNCSICPVSTFCLAFKQNQVDQFPIKPAKKFLPHQHWVALVPRWKNTVLIRQRPLRGIWGGLWEFPSTSLEDLTASSKLAKSFAQALSISKITRIKKLEPILHAFSHFKLTLSSYLVELKKPELPPNLVWMNLSENRYPMPVPHLKILAQLRGKNEDISNFQSGN